MIWFYEQQGRFRRVELHPEEDHYRLVVADAEASETVEDYDDYDAVVRRTVVLDLEWKREGWNGPYGRDVR
jgi:hypothetical protein